MHALIIEDEIKVAGALRRGLEAEGYEVVVANDGDEGFARASTGKYGIILLDLMLPHRSGLEILQSLRAEGLQTPILVLTAKDAIDDRVNGLDAGADDYLVKPFAFAELLARIRALSRRGRPQTADSMNIDDLVVNMSARRVHRNGVLVQLTAKEFDLLSYLLRHRGHVVSREMLARDIWDEPRRVTPLDNVIDVHVARLRRKIDDGHEVPLIRTVRGVGFIIEHALQ